MKKINFLKVRLVLPIFLFAAPIILSGKLAAQAHSENSDPSSSAFQRYPDTLIAASRIFSAVFESGIGDTITLVLPGELIYKGIKRTEKTYRQDNVSFAFIEATGRHAGSSLSLKRSASADGSPVYEGRILGLRFMNGFRISSISKDSLLIEKIVLNNILME